MIKPKVFVGTLSSGEGDLEKCRSAIHTQVNVLQTHVVISDLPEKEAHNALWHEWRSRQSTYDMFVKVDADTVLADPWVLERLWTLMSSDPDITGIQAPLLDYFTDGHINGLNCFSPRVKFNDTSDELFCDRRVDVGHVRIIKSDLVPDELRPAGYHCYNAHEAQAFHFGVHRQLKGQIETMRMVRKAWHRHSKDRLRGMALLGALLSSNFADGGFNYGDQKFKDVLAATSSSYDRLIGDQ